MDPLTYFRACVDDYPRFHGRIFEADDLNLAAFRSKGAYREWFGQPPGRIGEPYRDEGFYTRELADLSMRLKPRKIVEFGTNLGMGTLLLHILNPSAELITVDNRTENPAGDGKDYPTGFLALENGARYEQRFGDAALCLELSVALCFIDADHSYEGVKGDSERAWDNRAMRWAIAWHDYNARHLGCMQAVNEFCGRHRLTLRQHPDSSTVWVEG